MATLTVTLPEDVIEWLDGLVAEGTIADPATYLENLILQDYLHRDRERIDALLIQGLDSGPSTAFTAQDWTDMRERLRNRLAARPSS